MSDNLVMVFTRNPELGKVKTRLAKTIGDEAALNIYNFLLNHTEIILRSLECDKAVYYSEKIRESDIWDKSIYQKRLQEGDNLGLKMQNSFVDAFKNGYKKVVIVGSDLYDLKAKHIQDAFKELDQIDVVIGPAHDGGYYLLGMKKLHSEVFSNKNWGTDTVLRDTLQDLKHINVHLLEELNDIDVYEDIKNISEFKQFL